MNRRTHPRCIYGLGLLDTSRRCSRPMEPNSLYCVKHMRCCVNSKKHRSRVELFLKGKCRSDYRDRAEYQATYWKSRKEKCIRYKLCMRCGKKNIRYPEFFSCGMCEPKRNWKNNPSGIKAK